MDQNELMQSEKVKKITGISCKELLKFDEYIHPNGTLAAEYMCFDNDDTYLVVADFKVNPSWAPSQKNNPITPAQKNIPGGWFCEPAGDDFLLNPVLAWMETNLTSPERYIAEECCRQTVNGFNYLCPFQNSTGDKDGYHKVFVKAPKPENYRLATGETEQQLRLLSGNYGVEVVKATAEAMKFIDDNGYDKANMMGAVAMAIQINGDTIQAIGVFFIDPENPDAEDEDMIWFLIRSFADASKTPSLLSQPLDSDAAVEQLINKATENCQESYAKFKENDDGNSETADSRFWRK